MTMKNCVRAMAFILLTSCVSQVQAAFTYDFEGLSDGVITGQDGWIKWPTWPESLDVKAGPAGSANTSKVISGFEAGFAAGAIRSMSPIYFTSADTAAEQRIWAYLGAGDVVNDASAPSGGGHFAGGTDQQPSFGMVKDITGVARTYVRSALPGSPENFGDGILEDHWYELKLVMDFSILGGRASLHRRDITAGDVTFTQDSLLVNVDLGVDPDAMGRYEVNGLNFRMDKASASYYDNYFLSSPVPEPSTIGLLAMSALSMIGRIHRRRRQ